jgi:fluoride exporter
MTSLSTISALGLVALGGGIGAALRLMVSQLVGRLLGGAFPWGTFSVNVLGGLVMGLVIGWFALRYPTGSSPLKLFLTTGVLGGFTTFSAFSLEMVDLMDGGKLAMAAVYALASVSVSVAAVYGGLIFAKSLS